MTGLLLEPAAAVSPPDDAAPRALAEDDEAKEVADRDAPPDVEDEAGERFPRRSIDTIWRI